MAIVRLQAMHSLASLLLIAFGVATASAYANFCSLGDARVVRRQWQDALGGSEGARSRLIGGAVVFDAYVLSLMPCSE